MEMENSAPLSNASIDSSRISRNFISGAEGRRENIVSLVCGTCSLYCSCAEKGKEPDSLASLDCYIPRDLG